MATVLLEKTVHSMISRLSYYRIDHFVTPSTIIRRRHLLKLIYVINGGT